MWLFLNVLYVTVSSFIKFYVVTCIFTFYFALECFYTKTPSYLRRWERVQTVVCIVTRFCALLLLLLLSPWPHTLHLCENNSVTAWPNFKLPARNCGPCQTGWI